MGSSTTTDIVLMFLSSGWYFLIAGAIIRSFYLCLRRTFCGYEEERISTEEEEEEQETPERYWTLSPARKEEIDNKREAAVLRYLNRFTLTLGDEHLLCCSESQTDTTLSSSTSEEKDKSVASNESCKEVERNNDIEEGNSYVVLVCNGGDMAQDSKPTAVGDAAVEYTHISLPLPGCDVAGIDICSTEAREENRQEGKGKRWKFSSLFRSGDDEGRETSQTEPVTITDNPNSQLQAVEKRSVPIFCAICLSKYEKGDRVCWSSNAECSHVFHEDCILQWLISSGKKRSIIQFFTSNPTDEELLKHEFCPYCRQDFICVKPAVLGSEESV